MPIRRPILLFSGRAGYRVVHVTKSMIWIVDLSLGNSVTNDAEYVVTELYKMYGDLRIIYRDTEGNWDELVHNAGKFERFKAARDILPPVNVNLPQRST